MSQRTCFLQLPVTQNQPKNIYKTQLLKDIIYLKGLLVNLIIKMEN